MRYAFRLRNPFPSSTALPFARPTLTQLRDQGIQDITTAGVPGLTGPSRNAALRARLVHGRADMAMPIGSPAWGSISWPKTSFFAWAALVGIYPKDATPAAGEAFSPA